jgi:hypothetical protein
MRTRSPRAVVATLLAISAYIKICSANNVDLDQDGDKAIRMPHEERALTIERASIDDIKRRLANKYTAFSADYVAAVVHHVYARLYGSPVRNFIPLLVERCAGEELSLLRPDLAPVAFADLRVVSRETIAV